MLRKKSIILLLFSLTLFFLHKLYSNHKLIEVSIVWDYVNFTPVVRLFELQYEENYPSLTDDEDDINYPLMKEAYDDLVTMKRGETKSFLVTIENNSSQPLFFIVESHHDELSDETLAIACFDHKKSYKVPANDTWHAKITITLSPSYDGEHFAIKHTLIGINNENDIESDHDTVGIEG